MVCKFTTKQSNYLSHAKYGKATVVFGGSFLDFLCRICISLSQGHVVLMIIGKVLFICLIQSVLDIDTTDKNFYDRCANNLIMFLFDIQMRRPIKFAAHEMNVRIF